MLNCQCVLYIFFKLYSAYQVKLQLMLIYNHNLLNYTLKCRFFKLCHRNFSFLKEVDQHIYLIKCFVLVIETC